jgi:hypothetical protein
VTGPALQIAAERVRESAAEILSRPEFRPQEESWLQRFLRDLMAAIDFPRAAEAGWVALWVLAGIGALFLGWLLARLLADASLGRRAQGAAATRGSPLDLRGDLQGDVQRRIDDLRARAQAARAAGDLVLALRLQFAALVIALGTRGDLDYRDAWTNRELFERGRPSEPVAALLAPLVEELDRKGFGGAPASEEDVETIERLSRHLLGARA